MECSSRVAGLQYSTPVGWMEHLEVSTELMVGQDDSCRDGATSHQVVPH